jgi:hypothetical protein
LTFGAFAEALGFKPAKGMECGCGEIGGVLSGLDRRFIELAGERQAA